MNILAFLKNQKITILLAGPAIAIALYACNGQVGVNKNLNTGMSTSYKGISTSGTKMIMNDEALNHADIPLGKSFIIVNDKVKGLTEKEGKVSVGCALTISDKDGKVLLSEPDLFKDNAVFEKIDYLRCLVNTGSPMKPEEKYNVHVIFTDKYGTGKIENDVTVRMINNP